MKKLVVWALVFTLLAASIPVLAAPAIPARVSSFNGGSQLILVTADNGSTSATLSCYRKTKGKWTKVASCAAVVGRKGLISAEEKREGDGHTPTGTYPLTRTFGQGKAPKGAKMPWRSVNANDYWVDDPKSDDYNTWVRTKENPKKRWNSFERLKISSYRLASVVEYNTDPIVKGKGSAIFLHIWKSKKSPTAGCVAVSESNMKSILKWLNPKSAPHIMIEFT